MRPARGARSGRTRRWPPWRPGVVPGRGPGPAANCAAPGPPPFPPLLVPPGDPAPRIARGRAPARPGRAAKTSAIPPGAAGLRVSRDCGAGNGPPGGPLSRRPRPGGRNGRRPGALRGTLRRDLHPPRGVRDGTGRSIRSPAARRGRSGVCQQMPRYSSYHLWSSGLSSGGAMSFRHWGIFAAHSWHSFNCLSRLPFSNFSMGGAAQ